MFLLEDGARVEVIDAITLQAAVDTELAGLCFTEEAAPSRVTLGAKQAVRVKVMEDPLLALAIV
jgi:hypothetical protein